MKPNQHNYLYKAMALPVISILLSAFTAIAYRQPLHTAVPSAINDTIPSAGAANTKPVDSLTMKDGQPDPANNNESPASDYDKIFTKVEFESSYPGGTNGWMKYLIETFRYPEQAQKKGIQGAVVVRFIVDEKGKLSDVEAISGPKKGGLREEAVRVVKQSGKWLPAVQNGRAVKSYKQQSIVFRQDN